MADYEKVERKAAVWPVGKPVQDDAYRFVRFSITPGVGSIANVDALGDMTAAVTQETPGVSMVTADVTHDGDASTSGIVYFGYSPSRGDNTHKSLETMKPSVEHALRLVAPMGGLTVEFLNSDPALVGSASASA